MPSNAPWTRHWPTHHIKLPRIPHQLHGAVVHQHILILHIGVFLRQPVHDGPPQPGGLQHIGLVHAGHLAAARPALADACPLKKETAEQGIDLLMVRELTGGIYFGKRDKYQTEDRGLEATDLMLRRALGIAHPHHIGSAAPQQHVHIFERVAELLPHLVDDFHRLVDDLRTDGSSWRICNRFP